MGQNSTQGKKGGTGGVLPLSTSRRPDLLNQIANVERWGGKGDKRRKKKKGKGKEKGITTSTSKKGRKQEDRETNGHCTPRY